jgi:hypothetical protein
LRFFSTGSACTAYTQVDPDSLLDRHAVDLSQIPDFLLDEEPGGRVGTPGCQIGHVDRTGCHHLVCSTNALPGLPPLPGVRLVTWNILGVINWCFDCKIPKP